MCRSRGGWQYGVLLCLAISVAAFAQTPPPSPQPADPASTSTVSVPSTESYCNSLLPGNPNAEPLRAACMFAMTFQERLPNFQCEMKVAKYLEYVERGHLNPSQIAFQRITGRARYVDGKDYYDDLRLDGAPANNREALLAGTWSVGEFGVRLLAAFAPQLSPDMAFVGENKMNGDRAFEYRFAVAKENNSLWHWVSKDVSLHPGYEGRIWIAKSDHRVLRVEMKSTDGVPEDYPLRVETTRTDFAFVDFKDGSVFLLPAVVRLDTSMRNNTSFRHVINFTKCQKFRGTGRILTDTPK